MTKLRLLAHEMEEENFLIEEVVVEWETATIQNGNEDFVPMHRLRYELFVRMDYLALVSRKVCEDVLLPHFQFAMTSSLFFVLFLYR